MREDLLCRGVPMKLGLSLASSALIALTVYACSLDNQEGPNVTCADLECGRINACQEGIIAQCVDRENVRFHVCGTEDICTAGWQRPGEYRCAAEITDCEGCRPERVDGCGTGGNEGGSGGATTSTTGGMSSGGGGAGGEGGSGGTGGVGGN
jgi:hypothetical protein